MTTVQQNNVKALEASLPYPIIKDGTFDINGGDLVYYDTTAKIIKVLDDATTHCAYFAGMALNGSYIQPYTTKQYMADIPVMTKGRIRLNTTSGDTYAHGDALYFGADAQTVTKTDPGAGVIIGYAWIEGGGTLAGGTGVKLDLTLAVRYPTSAFA